MNSRFRIVNQAEQLQEGLFGQVFLYIFEVLPWLDTHGLQPDWAVRSALYGRPENDLVVPGLLELNYAPPAGILPEENLLTLRERHSVALGNDWDYVGELWKKYFRLSANVRRAAESYPNLEGALGLHYRGTDKNTSLVETNYVSAEDFLTLAGDFIAKHPAIRTVFLATDEKGFVEKFRAQHPSLQVVNTGEVTHHKHVGVQDDFAKGEHALLDCLLLSRCRYLLKCQSALSAFAKVLNPKLEAYRISANKLAYWNLGAPYFPDGNLPKLTSSDPECQKILKRLSEGDWTLDVMAMKRYGPSFRFQKRKGYMRRAKSENRWELPLWSWDGLHWRWDARVARLRNWLGY